MPSTAEGRHPQPGTDAPETRVADPRVGGRAARLHAIGCLLGIGLAACAAPARAADCRPNGDLTVEIVLLEPKIAYDESRSSLDDLSSTAYHAIPGGHAIGLTRMTFTYGFEGDLMVTNVDGRVCLVPRNVKMKVGYSDGTVYVRRDQTGNECRRQAVLDHEHEHVRINLQTLRDAEDGVRRDVEKLARQRVAAIASDRQAAEEDLKGQLNRIMEDALRPMMERREAMHRAFDDRESENRRAGNCG
jgi:hypothetical protein